MIALDASSVIKIMDQKVEPAGKGNTLFCSRETGIITRVVGQHNSGFYLVLEKVLNFEDHKILGG